MKPIILAALALFAAFGAVLQKPEYPKIVNKNLWADNDFRGKRAPDFIIERWLNASSVDTRGKVLLIDFWATWCGPCRTLIPELNEHQSKFKDKLMVIGVSDEPQATVREFLKTTKMAYAVGIDTKKSMASKIGIKGIPHVLLISPDGIVRWQGFPGSDEERLSAKIIQQVIDASGMKVP